MNFQNSHSYADQDNRSRTYFSEEVVAAAIAGVIGAAKAEGKSLEDVTEEVLSEDTILDNPTRKWLSNIVTEAWVTVPEDSEGSFQHSA